MGAAAERAASRLHLRHAARRGRAAEEPRVNKAFKRIAALEIFDDPDQFALIMSHYCLVFAASGACVPLVGACSGG